MVNPTDQTPMHEALDLGNSHGNGGSNDDADFGIICEGETVTGKIPITRGPATSVFATVEGENWEIAPALPAEDGIATTPSPHWRRHLSGIADGVLVRFTAPAEVSTVATFRGRIVIRTTSGNGDRGVGNPGYFAERAITLKLVAHAAPAVALQLMAVDVPVQLGSAPQRIAIRNGGCKTANITVTIKGDPRITASATSLSLSPFQDGHIDVRWRGMQGSGCQASAELKLRCGAKCYRVPLCRVVKSAAMGDAVSSSQLDIPAEEVSFGGVRLDSKITRRVPVRNRALVDSVVSVQICHMSPKSLSRGTRAPFQVVGKRHFLLPAQSSSFVRISLMAKNPGEFYRARLVISTRSASMRGGEAVRLASGDDTFVQRYSIWMSGHAGAPRIRVVRPLRLASLHTIRGHVSRSPTVMLDAPACKAALELCNSGDASGYVFFRCIPAGAASIYPDCLLLNAGSVKRVEFRLRQKFMGKSIDIELHHGGEVARLLWQQQEPSMNGLVPKGPIFPEDVRLLDTIAKHGACDDVPATEWPMGHSVMRFTVQSVMGGKKMRPRRVRSRKPSAGRETVRRARLNVHIPSTQESDGKDSHTARRGRRILKRERMARPLSFPRTPSLPDLYFLSALSTSSR